MRSIWLMLLKLNQEALLGMMIWPGCSASLPLRGAWPGGAAA
jgi:hypothetical protein